MNPVIWTIYLMSQRGPKEPVSFAKVYEGPGRKAFRTALEGLGKLLTVVRVGPCGHTYHVYRSSR